MDLGLRGRNAVVLGGTRGIGRAIAGTLAGEGAGVAVCARNADQVKSTVAELQAKGVRAIGASIDITDGAALKSWIASAARELGGIDMLFSNAGAMAQGGDPASWEQNFRLDVLGAVNAFEAARPFLEASGEKNGDAAFIIISSISAAQADTASSYGPVKAALVHMAKGLARQHAGKKIRVNVVSPGTVYFKGVSGTRSSRTCPSDIMTRLRAIRPAAWPRRRRLRTRPCSLRAPPPRLRPVQIWWSMALSQIA
jgi:3-oxoacyl-[acyl-carrier protein] reductase